MLNDCDTCKFEDYDVDHESCKSCIFADKPDAYWEAKEGSNENV